MLVTVTSAMGSTVMAAEAELLPLLLSMASGVDTVAVLAMAPLAIGRFTVMVMVRGAPLVTLSRVQVTVEPKLHDSPAWAPVITALPPVMPALPLYQACRLSLTVAVGATSVPRLDTVRV